MSKCRMQSVPAVTQLPNTALPGDSREAPPFTTGVWSQSSHRFCTGKGTGALGEVTGVSLHLPLRRWQVTLNPLGKVKVLLVCWLSWARLQPRREAPSQKPDKETPRGV